MAKHAAKYSRKDYSKDDSVKKAAGRSDKQDASNAVPKTVTLAEANKKAKTRKTVAIVLGSIVGVIALVYLGGVLVFTNLFFPQTRIADIDISLKNADEVHDILQSTMDDYKFKVQGEGLDITITSSQAGMSLDSQTITEDMHSRVNPWAWPVEVFTEHDETESLVASYATNDLSGILAAAADQVNASAKAPVNAAIAFDETKGAYVITPEEGGTMINPEALAEVVSAKAAVLTPVITVDSSVLQTPTVYRDDPRLAEALEAANQLVRAKFNLTLGNDVVATVDSNLLSQWITLDENYTATLDEEAMVAWATELAQSCNTIGSERTYTRPDGKVITVKGGDYGWSVDVDAAVPLIQEAVWSGATGDLALPTKRAGGAWQGRGAQDWSNRYIDVDLTEQKARFYGDDESIIWESDIVSGNPTQGNGTPQGVYYIKSNDGASELIGLKPDGTEDYRTKVDFWMPFKGNSIGFHDANWQSSFGGSRYTYAGSHGCINLPPAKAEELHGLLQVGDAVIVHG